MASVRLTIHRSNRLSHARKAYLAERAIYYRGIGMSRIAEAYEEALARR